MAGSYEPGTSLADLPLADLEDLALELIESGPSQRRDELAAVVCELVRRAKMTDLERLRAGEQFPTVDAAFDSLAATHDVHVRRVDVDRGSPEAEQIRRRFAATHALALAHPLPPISGEELTRILLADEEEG